MTDALTRRGLLGLAASTILVSSSLRAAETRGAVTDEGGISAIIDPEAQPVTVYAGGRWCEGPVWSSGHGGLVFSDVRANRIQRLGADGQAVPLRDPSNYANGNAIDAEGRLVTCEHLGRRVVRQDHGGRISVLADRFDGKPLNAPNDIVVARDGALWFTDPIFGLMDPEEGRQAPAEQRGRYLFRLDAAGRLEIASDSFEQPNGLAFSPDGSILYVSDTSGSLDPEGRREIRAFDVGDNGRLRRERIFATVPSGVPDGLKVDTEGRVYAATEAGARIWAADGTPVGRIATPGTCGNLAFGGPDGRRLFLCNGTDIHAVDLKTRGAGWRA